MIELQHLTKTYKTRTGEVHAIEDIDLTIEDGDIFGIIGKFSVNEGDARFQNTGLFPGDESCSVAEMADVVKGDVGDDAQVGGYDVCTVEPAAKPHLNDCHIYLLLCKIGKCHSCGEFEKRW